MQAERARDASSTGRRGRTSIRSPFYTGVGVMMLVLAVAGFWPQYYTVIIGGSASTTTRHWLIHLHSALFLGWLFMFIMQTALVWRTRLVLHRRLGPPMAAYGFASGAVGLFAGLALAARFGRMNGGVDAAASFAAFPLIDMFFFAGFLALGMAFRFRPQIHKRAMFVATYSIAVVGIGRLVARFVPVDMPWTWQPAVLSPLLLAVMYDGVIHKRAHPVIIFALAAHLFRLNMEALTSSDTWLSVGRILVRPFW